VLIALGTVTYAAVLFLGDLVGLWRGYVWNAIASLSGAMAPGGKLAAKMTPA
jgi:hypothetical protein